MRAITLQQPWASLLAWGYKVIETRSWSASYRGPIAIHSSAAYPPHCREVALLPEFREPLNIIGFLPLGSFLAIGTLDDCRPCRPTSYDAVGFPECVFGDFTPGRYMLYFKNVRRLATPIPYRGALSLWTVPPEMEIRLHAQAGTDGAADHA